MNACTIVMAAGCEVASPHANWEGSVHAVAQQVASDETVQGRFDGAPVDLGTLVATPWRDGGRFKVTVADAVATRALVVHGVIGVDPLQQLLLDDGSGRLVVAPIAWDVRRERWFDPSEGAVSGEPDDALYWAGMAGNWNHQCASCHQTGFNKGFDVETRSYQALADHRGVTCAACHGADGQADLSTQQAEVETCAPCHALREPISAAWSPGEPFLDHFAPALLDSGMWSSDGGLLYGREVFEWGSFVQSRMYAAGVRCTDCHDAHSGGLRAQGNALCTRCHDGSAFDSPAHHGQAADTDAALCTTCHMPTTLFMGIDARHDHNIRVPGAALEPFESLLADALNDRAADQTGLRAAVADVSLGAMRRASALRLLALARPGDDEREVRAALSDPESLVRAAAAGTMGAWGRHTDEVETLLRDPVRLVRVSAATGLAGRPVADGAAYASVVAEVEAALPAAADLPSAHNNLGVLRAAAGDPVAAIDALTTALHLDPSFVPARQNLAMLRGLVVDSTHSSTPGGTVHPTQGE